MFQHEYTCSEDIEDIIIDAQFNLASKILAAAMRIIGVFPRSRLIFRRDGPQYPRVCLGYVCIWIVPMAPNDSNSALLYLVELEGKSSDRPFATDQIDVAIARARRAETTLKRGALRRFERSIAEPEGAASKRHRIHLRKLTDRARGTETAF